MTTLNTIIEEEKKRFDRHFLGTEPDGEWEPNEIKNGTWTLFAYAAKNYLTTAMQRAYEAAKVERDTYWKEQLQKAREEVLNTFIEKQQLLLEQNEGRDNLEFYSGYLTALLDIKHLMSKAYHSELDQDKK